MHDVRTAARAAITEMEAMIENLRVTPTENFGFVEALKTQCDALGFRTGADVMLKVGELPPPDALGPGAQHTLFRFAQEALANVGRRARAAHVTVAVGVQDQSLNLTVSDDGIGFDAQAPRAGLGRQNMMARAAELGGTFLLQTSPGGGTRVGCSIPYERVNADAFLMRAVAYGVLAAAMVPLISIGGLDHCDAIRAIAAILGGIAAASGVGHIAAWYRVRAGTSPA
jgi:signal transduction histidine kinase